CVDTIKPTRSEIFESRERFIVTGLPISETVDKRYWINRHYSSHGLRTNTTINCDSNGSLKQFGASSYTSVDRHIPNHQINTNREIISINRLPVILLIDVRNLIRRNALKVRAG